MVYQATPVLVDSHCHLNFDAFDQDRHAVVERARHNGIVRILNPGVDLETSRTAIRCTREFPEVYAAVGVHPNDGSNWSASTLIELEELAGDEKVVAIGEIGLDYYRDFTPRDVQRSIFRQQLELAAKLGLPVIIHNREASEDLLYILKEWYKIPFTEGSGLLAHPGVLHSFSGDEGFAREVTELHFKLGIAGPVTFRNSEILHSVVKSMPLESLLVETDAPYLAPHPFRGKRNEPANVRIVAEKVAELKKVPLEDVAKITMAGVDQIFGWRKID